MITACFERCPGMIIFRMIAYRPRGTACQREQKNQIVSSRLKNTTFSNAAMSNSI